MNTSPDAADRSGAAGVPRPAKKIIRFLFENSIFLMTGAVLAMIWANADLPSYERFIHSPLFGRTALGGSSLLHLVNDVFMALFFAMAAKEVWEALLPGGSLSSWKTAATPLMATLGGVFVPAGVYLAGCVLTGEQEGLGRGWAVPCATDIAFSYLVARFVFGPGHSAIAFLLLLAIADDAAGLLILAIAYPQQALQPEWLLLSVAAVAVGIALRKKGVHSFWWYLLGPGIVSWFAFHQAGIHAALSLVPIIPTMPASRHDSGMFAEDELKRPDTLSEFAAWWKNPVEMILGLFGLVNAGVVLSNSGNGTWLVLAGLLIGKPLGITLFTALGEKLFGFRRPAGMSWRHVFTMGIVAGIGFTVALFVASAAFPDPGVVQDSVKMGALGSFAAAVIAIAFGRLCGIRPVVGTGNNIDTAAASTSAAGPDSTPASASVASTSRSSDADRIADE